MKTITILLHQDIKNDARVLNIISSLSKRSIVLVFFVSNSNDNDFKLYANNNNVKFYPISYPNSLFRNILRHTFFIFEYYFLYKKVLDTNLHFDIIYCNDLPTLHSGMRLKRKFNAKLVYDSHEIYLETINQFFIFSDSKLLKKLIFSLLIFFMRKIGKYYEHKFIKKIDKFITVNFSLANYFQQFYSLSYMPTVIMNFPDKQYCKTEINNKIDYRKIFNWNKEDIIFLYQGVLNNGRGLNLLLESFTEVGNNKRLVILGGGILKNDLEKFVVNNNLTNKVKLLGFVPYQQLCSYTKGADIGVNLLEPVNISKKMASPNKLFQYIRAEIPSINTNTYENQRVVKLYNVGWLVDNDIKILRNFINTISTEEINRKKARCVEIKDLFLWEQQEYDLFDIVLSKQ